MLKPSGDSGALTSKGAPTADSRATDSPDAANSAESSVSSIPRPSDSALPPEGAESAGRPKAFFLSAEPPYPITGGGALRSASILEFLAQHYVVDVTLFSEQRAPDPRVEFPAGRARRISVIPLSHHSKTTAARLGRAARRLLRNRPPLIDRFSGFERQVAALIDGEQYDIAVVEHVWCAQYLRQIRPRARRLFLDAHNIESEWHERVGRSGGKLQALVFGRFAKACRRFEQKWLPHYDLVLTPSEREASHIPGGRAVVYPNAIPLAPRPVRNERQEIVFTGNLEYQPNISAVRFFHTKVWPLVRERVPDLVWRIAGKNPAAVERFVAGDPRVQVTGPMDDAIATLATAKVAVVPLLAGSGTRFKILEAWAAGTPVVSTKLGAEGLLCRAGEHLLLCDDPSEFAEAVAFLVEAPEARAQLSEAGRRLYEAAYTWDVAWSILERQLAQQHKPE